MPHQGRRDVELQSFRDQLGHCQELDAVAQFAGVAHVGHVHRVDARPRDEFPIDPGGKGQVSENGQLLRSVAAVDIHGRIGLGVAQPLRLGQGIGIGLAAILHLREDEVAGAVEDSVNRLDLVGHERLVDGRDDRNPAAHGGLEGDRPADAPGAIEKLAAMFRQQGLVRRDDVLAALQDLEHDGAIGLEAADKLHDRLDLRIIEDRRQLGGQKPGRRRNIAGTSQVRIDNPHQFHLSADLAGNAIRVFQQKSCHAGADGPETNNGYFRG